MKLPANIQTLVSAIRYEKDLLKSNPGMKTAIQLQISQRNHKMAVRKSLKVVKDDD